MNEDQASVAAKAMEQAAIDAANAAKEAVIAVCERAYPNNETDEREGHRFIGAAITAMSMAYGDMLRTVLETQPRSKAEIAVTLGLFKTIVADPIKELADLATKMGPREDD